MCCVVSWPHPSILYAPSAALRSSMMILVLSAGLLWTLLCLSALLLNRVLPHVDVHVRWPHMVTVYVDTEALNRCAGVF